MTASHEPRNRAAQASSLSGIRRLLLVEFIDLDRFPGQIAALYPLLRGHAQRRGVSVRWLRFGIATSNAFVHGTDAVTLSPEELARLLEVEREQAPETIVLTHALAEDQAAALRPARLVLLADLVEQERARGEPEAFRASEELDRPDFVPDYRWEPGNAGALRRDRDNVYVWLRSECGYRRSVTSNPCYRDLPLSEHTRTRGCAFCGVPARADGREESDETPLSWITRQLEALRATRGERSPNAVILENLESARVAEHVFASLARLGMDETRVLFALRADRLVGLRESLENHLRGSSGGGVHVHVMGLESFSDDELLRFHKGFDGATALRAVLALQELQERHPERFHYAGYRPLATILFTPWTTFADLDLNLGLIEHLGIAGEIGNIFVSRLRLHDDLAITALARRDGLLTERLSDEALRLNRRKLFPTELGWRFRDERLEIVNSLTTRLEGEAALSEDDLARTLARWMRTLGPTTSWRQEDRVALVRCLAEEAASHPAPLPAERLLEGAFARLRARRDESAPGGATQGDRFRLGAAELPLSEYLGRVAALIGEDKPALSLPGVSEAAFAGAGTALSTLGLRARHHEGTLFVSRDESTLARVVTLAARAPSASPDELPALRRELGALFGYPSCCAESWGTDEWAAADLPRWALMARRARYPGPLPLAYDPTALPDLIFVPCRADCPAAAARYRAWSERLGLDAGENSLSLLSLEGPERWARVSVRSQEGPLLGYDPSRVEGRGPLADCLTGASHLRLRSAQVQVEGPGGPLGRWTASLGPWPCGAMVAAEEWSLVSHAARRRARPTTTRRVAPLAAADPVTGGEAAMDRSDERQPPTQPTDGLMDWSELTLTSRCNQRCFFCYEEARDNSTDPSLEQVKALMRQTRERADQVVLCGREALLREDIHEIVAYGDELGLSTVVFTNGQELAHPGAVERLVAAGCSSVAVSFHFPDAESFARGARVRARGFDKVLAGLRNLRDYNERHPEAPLPVSTETDMHALNEGRLADMRATLVEALGRAPWKMRLASLLPTKVYDIGLDSVVDDLPRRREEVAALVASQPEEIPLGFVKVPLCLLPEGEEQRCLDVRYVHEGTVLTFNHAEPSRVTLDAFSNSTGRDIAGILRQNPYRWLCRRCEMLPLCRFERTEWGAPGFAPTARQRPLPYQSSADSLLAGLDITPRQATAREVFARLGPDGGGLRFVQATRQVISDLVFPEEDVLDALLARDPDGQPRLVDAWCEHAPGLVLVFAVAERRVTLHLGPRPPQGHDPAQTFLVSHLVASPVDLAPPAPEDLRACLTALTAITLPALERWEGSPWFDAASARARQALWLTLGPNLWPGASLPGGWSVQGLRESDEGAPAVLLEHPSAGAAVLIARHRDAAGAAPEIFLADEVAQTAALPLAAALDAAGATEAASTRVYVGLRGAGLDGEPSAPEGREQGGRPGLRVEFRAPGHAPVRFAVGPHTPERPYFRRVGDLVLWYEDSLVDASSETATRVVLAAMKHLQASPPAAATEALWSRALLELAGRVPRLKDATWQVRWQAESGSD